jgi:hypothetical protein
VALLLSGACTYCGETELQMSLDRINNTIGHLLSNVNSCCVRCNYLRRNMPYAAWIEIVPAIRIAREKRLFESWFSFGGRTRQASSTSLKLEGRASAGGRDLLSPPQNAL